MEYLIHLLLDSYLSILLRHKHLLPAYGNRRVGYLQEKSMYIDGFFSQVIETKSPVFERSSKDGDPFRLCNSLTMRAKKDPKQIVPCPRARDRI